MLWGPFSRLSSTATRDRFVYSNKSRSSCQSPQVGLRRNSGVCKAGDQSTCVGNTGRLLGSEVFDLPLQNVRALMHRELMG